MNNIDSLDRAILSELQQDCSRSVQDIGDAVGLSQSPCWKRIRRLEDSGILQKRVALLDPAKVGLGVTVFVTIRTNQHNEEWLDRFAAAIADIPEVIEIYRMSGDVDYLMKILASDIEDYDRIYKKLIRSVEMFDVSSSFAMEQLKYTTALPLPEVD